MGYFKITNGSGSVLGSGSLLILVLVLQSLQKPPLFLKPQSSLSSSSAARKHWEGHAAHRLISRIFFTLQIIFDDDDNFLGAIFIYFFPFIIWIIFAAAKFGLFGLVCNFFNCFCQFLFVNMHLFSYEILNVLRFQLFF